MMSALAVLKRLKESKDEMKRLEAYRDDIETKAQEEATTDTWELLPAIVGILCFLLFLVALRARCKKSSQSSDTASSFPESTPDEPASNISSGSRSGKSTSKPPRPDAARPGTGSTVVNSAATAEPASVEKR